MRATIVGAGISGLCTAIGLRDAGWQVTVLEKWPSIVGIGAALGLWPEAQDALRELGMGDALDQHSVAPGAAGVYRKDGRALIRIAADSKRIPPVRLISRRRLMAALTAAADGIEIRTGVVPDAPALRGAQAEADVLVGADGVESSVRTAFFGDCTRPRYSGMVAWRGVVDVEAPDQGETWGDGMLFGLTPIEPGCTNFYAAVPAAEQQPGTFQDLRERFADWRAPIPDVLARADPATVLRNPIHDLHPALPNYVHENVVLVGDAAHAMTPNIGRGACEAIVDALCLVNQLRARSVPDALAGYDGLRRRPSQRVAARSWRMMWAVRSRPLAPLRDGMLRAAGLFLH